jgi:diguanylate cyclase (GGDEF)-like protein
MTLADDIEAAYHAIGAQQSYGDFVETLVETVSTVFGARACTFADASSGHAWRWDRGGVEVRLDDPIANTDSINGVTMGNGGDLDAPFFDEPRPYIIAPLERAEGTPLAWLYLFDPSKFDASARARFEGMAQYATVLIQNIRLLEDAQRLAFTDPLTGIPNRRALEIELRGRIDTNEPFCYIFMDLDGFKQINDTQGHDAGDEALKSVASALQHASRRGDFIARFAGDEFIAILDGSAQNSQPFMERVVDGLQLHGIRTSHGVAQYPDDGATSATLHKAADDRLYKVKRARNSRR